MSLENTGFTESLILIVFFLLALISVQLFRTGRGIAISNTLLGTLFALLSIQIFISYLTVTQVLAKPIFIVIDDTLLLGVGPLLFLYVRTTLTPSRRPDQVDLIHFIPLIFLLVPFLFFLFTTTDYSQWLLGFNLSESILDIASRKFQWTSFLMVTHISIYLVGSFLYAHRTPDKEAINYQWVRFTLISFAVIILASYIQIFRPFLFIEKYPPVSFILILVTLLFFLIQVLMKGMDGGPIFSENRIRYENSKLGAEEKNLIQEKLRKLIEDDELYLRSDLTVKALAEMVNTHPKKLSQVVNEVFSKSFYDLMNHYRIDHAVRLLNDPSKMDMTISEIQYSSGFNSKSSFHTQFRKKTGQSPKEYKKDRLFSSHS